MRHITTHLTFARRLSPFYDLISISLGDSDAYASSYDNKEKKGLSTLITSDLPYDVNEKKLYKYLKDNNIPASQRLFDKFSWQTFIALNWPSKGYESPKKGQDISNLTSRLQWEYYRRADSIFLKDGKQPQTWDQGTSNSQQSRVPLLNQSLQAFQGPLIDQNGKWVRYEVLVNKIEFDYVYNNKLYSQEGQIKFTSHHPIAFPANEGTRKAGAMEIKLSWKQLGAHDDPTRFLVRKAYVEHTIADSKGNIIKSRPTLETMGLVGMHIAVRTKSSPTWVWATFEHVDNVNANDLKKNSHGYPLRPNFNNPDTPTKVVNTLASKNAVPDANGTFTSWAENFTTSPTQVLQLVPVPAATDALNHHMHHLLKKQKSVLQYYKLIGTQWPVNPNFPAFPGGTSNGSVSSSPESIIYKTPGMVVPVYLNNNTMETFFQYGNQAAGPLEEDDRLPSGEVSDTKIVFGTESCNGCHFSAGATIGFKVDENGKVLIDKNGYRTPVFGKNGNFGQTGNANYSWLLQMRAKSKPVTTQ